MSARSFDMTRTKSASHTREAPTPVRASKPSREKAPKRKPSLRQGRERARSVGSTLFLVLLCILMGASVYGVWRPEVRIVEVHVVGIESSEQVEILAKETMAGRYAGILPKDSIFFYPEKEMRQSILSATPALADVTIARESFTALTISGTRREAAFFWCGERREDVSLEIATCYETDATGFVFAPVTGTSSDAHNPAMLHLYGALLGDTPTPLGRTVAGASYVPGLLSFIEGIKKLGVPVQGVYVEGDEAHLMVTPFTRVRYVLGNEAEALTSAAAAFDTLTLTDGSIEYVDVRFPGKLYVKRYE